MIRIYADKACEEPIKVVEWDSGYILTLINGEREELPNTAEAGKLATATVYLKNDSKNRFAITKLSFPDKRVKVSVESSWILVSPVKLTISFLVPKDPKSNDAIKAGKIEIEGYYIINE